MLYTGRACVHIVTLMQYSNIRLSPFLSACNLIPLFPSVGTCRPWGCHSPWPWWLSAHHPQGTWTNSLQGIFVSWYARWACL